jgi:hypothetical protein
MKLLILIELAILMAILLGWDGGNPKHKDRADTHTHWET